MTAPPPAPRSFTDTHRALVGPIQDVVAQKGSLTMAEIHALAGPLAGATSTRPISVTTVRSAVRYLLHGELLVSKNTERGVEYLISTNYTKEVDLKGELKMKGVASATHVRIGGAFLLRVCGTNRRYVHVPFPRNVPHKDKATLVKMLKRAQELLEQERTSTPCIDPRTVVPRDNGIDPIQLRDARIAARARLHL